MPIKPESKPFRFAAPRAAKLGVDRNLGVLTGIALITAGVEAKGHGIFIDAKTLSTAAAVLAERGARLKAAIRHLSWDEYFEEGGDRIENFPGWFSGCAVKGDQLVAEKLEFYDVFKQGAETRDTFSRILEMAEKTPELFGVSLEPWGFLVYVGEDGVEYSERPKDIPLKYDGLPALRVTELFFGALVDEPAANPGGLFAKLSKKISDSELVAVLRQLFSGEHLRVAGPVALAPALAAVESAAAQIAPVAGLKGNDGPVGPAGEAAKPALAAAKPAVSAGLVNSPASIAPSHLAMKQIIDSIKAEFGADKAKFSQAMSIFGENSEITFEALKAKMVALDLAASTAQVTTLTTENAKLKTDLATAEKARDEWKGKFEGIKNSGQAVEVPLGAPSTGAGEPNPWAAGSVNLTRQAEISKADPTRAAALKASANPVQPAAVAAPAK